MKVQVLCKFCGSCNVLRDATAAWNVSTQKWELAAVQDQAYCNQCGGETTLTEAHLED